MVGCIELITPYEPELGCRLLKLRSSISPLQENLISEKSIGQILQITFIFVRCFRSSAGVTPVKYERDSIQFNNVLIILKNWEINGTEKIGLVTPATGLHSIHIASLEN